MNYFDRTTLVVTLLAMASFVAMESDVSSSIATAIKCKQPNTSETKFCKKLPDDAISSCSDMGSWAACTNGRVYEINNFPKGSVDAECGGTKDEQADCWRSDNCIWDAAAENCYAGGWTSWNLAAKTVVDPANKCKTKKPATGDKKDSGVR